MNIHIGCAYNVGKSWKNYDCTPTSRIEKIPIIGNFIKIKLYKRRFPKEVINLPYRINIDTGCFFSGKLSSVCLNDNNNERKFIYS